MFIVSIRPVAWTGSYHWPVCRVMVTRRKARKVAA